VYRFDGLGFGTWISGNGCLAAQTFPAIGSFAVFNFLEPGFERKGGVVALRRDDGNFFYDWDSGANRMFQV